MASVGVDAATFIRPARGEVVAAWNALFSDPLISLGNLKAEAVSTGIGPASPDGNVLLRSVYWRFYLGLLPPPTSLDLFPPALASSRRAYEELRRRYLIAPDGRWAADCTGGEGFDPSSPNASKGGSAPGWDPLSLEQESPWQTWFAHLDLRATIRQDVDRTFPDIAYFSAESVRRSLTTMLFLFAVINPDVGYRQGMHELLAVCLMVVDHDSIPAQQSRAGQASTSAAATREEAMVATLDRAYIEHDAFELFIQLMRPAKEFYEWRAEEGPAAVVSGAPVAPIIARCQHLHSELRRVDPQLWEHLESEGVETQIWAIRWIRLILTRELPFGEALRLWDGMFADDPALGILDYVCIAMLLLIRNELIHADYSTLLTNLLHYPSPSATYPFKAVLLLAQAKVIRSNVSSASGAEIVMQNQEFLGVKAGGNDRISEEPMTPNSYRTRGTPSPRPGSATRAKGRAGMQGLAQGLFERAQKAGIDKAIFSTVADLRSSLPDSSTAYSFLPSFSPSGTPNGGERESSPYSSIPSTTAALPRPALHGKPVDDAASIKSLLDAERQLAEVRLAMLSMGKAMSEWMDVIRNEGGKSESQEATEAWHGLDRVRNTLLEAAGSEVDDLVRDWAWNDGLDTSRSRASSAAPTPVDPSQTEHTPANPPPPAPVFHEPESTPKAQGDGFGDRVALPQPPVHAVAKPVHAAKEDKGSHGSKLPPLHLSTRDARPAASLPRTPLHHPHPRPSASPTSAKRLSDGIALAEAATRRVSTPPTPSNGASYPASSSPSVPGKSADMGMDPLAGIPLDERRRSGIGSRNSMGAGDTSLRSPTGTALSPRMAVGSDPLGAHT